MLQYYAGDLHDMHNVMVCSNAFLRGSTRPCLVQPNVDETVTERAVVVLKASVRVAMMGR